MDRRARATGRRLVPAGGSPGWSSSSRQTGRTSGTTLGRMAEAVAAPNSLAAERASRRRRLVRIAGWLAGLVALLVVLNLAGVDVWDWLQQLWDTVTEISFWYVVLGCLFQGLQTT